MSDVRLSIIIVTYNSERTIKQCLDSLTDLRSNSIEILVFDNASSDSTPSILSSYSSKISLESSDRNFGFSAACNWCAGKAESSSHLAFINPDAVVSPDLVLRAVDSFSDMSVSLVGFACMNPNGLMDKNFRRYPSILSGVGTLLDRMTSKFLYKSNFDVQKHYLDGSCMFVKRSEFLEAGGFQDFFLYGEDTVLCDKLKKKNIKAVYHADLSYLHLRGNSSSSVLGERSWSMLSNMVYGELFYLRDRSLQSRGAYLLLRYFELTTLIIFSLFFFKSKNSKRNFFKRRLGLILRYSIPFLLQGNAFYKSEFHVLSSQLSQHKSAKLS